MSAKKQAQLLQEINDLRVNKNYEAIDRPLAKYLAICKGSGIALLVEAEKSLATGEYDAAIAKMQDALGTEDVADQARAMLAKALYDNGNNEEAEQLCEKVEASCTNDAVAGWSARELCVYLEAMLVRAHLLEYDCSGFMEPLTKSMPSLSSSHSAADTTELREVSEETRESVLKSIGAYQRVHDLAMEHFNVSKMTPPAVARGAAENAQYRIARLFLSISDISGSIETLRACVRGRIPASGAHKRRVLQMLGRVLLFATPLKEYPEPPAMAASSLSLSAFVPHHPTEEAALAFLLQSASAADEEDFDDPSVYDDLVLTFTSANAQCPEALVAAYERGLSHCSQNPHVWYQFALLFMSLRQPQRALVALSEYQSMAGSSPTSLLLAAKIHLRLGDTQSAIDASQKCVAACREASAAKSAAVSLEKAHHALGVALFLHSKKLGSIRQQVEMGKLALQNCTLAYESSEHAKNDYRLLFHMAMIYGSIRETERAINFARRAVELNPYHAPAFTLLVLLSTCTKDLTHSLRLAEAALEHHPTNVWLLVTKGKIEMALGRRADVVETLKRACIECKKTQSVEEDRLLSSARTPIHFGDIRSATSHNSSEELSDLEDKGTSCGAVSEESQRSLSSVTSLWIHLALAFAENSAYDDAIACANEAVRLHRSPDTHHAKGRVFEMKGLVKEAEEEYNAALKLDTNHEANLLRKAYILHHVHGELEAAEGILSSFVRKNPLSHQAWHQYGKVFKDKGDMSSASDCIITALNLEATSPILPLSMVPMEL